MHKGSCLCGAVGFELLSEPRATTHCHCRMCQKQHGAAFATYASLPESDLRYLSGKACLSSSNSSADTIPRIVSSWGSNPVWSGSGRFPGWVSIAVAALDTPFFPMRIVQIQQ